MLSIKNALLPAGLSKKIERYSGNRLLSDSICMFEDVVLFIPRVKNCRIFPFLVLCVGT